MIMLIPSVYFWLIVLIACLIAEACTTQLLTIWFAVGSVGALIAAALGFNEAVQLGVCLVLSFVLLLLLRPLVRNVLHLRQDRTNADRILDQTAVVIQTIDERNGTGQIRLMGQVWTARALQKDEVIATGETVVVRRISGVKAMVERLEQNDKEVS
ncbi:MAG: NfeD family protein [Eubacteriales bacterium]|nr:NfeD family protein [Eubacteriales bacterium]